jgi:hypothetical protein
MVALSERIGTSGGRTISLQLPHSTNDEKLGPVGRKHVLQQVAVRIGHHQHSFDNFAPVTGPHLLSHLE